ncbi:MAG: zinc ribbon domain-containing protein [Phycisphaerae bacterium]|nr:zinc ribbon domain-containing protein [Phycisphaerae bacterium]
MPTYEYQCEACDHRFELFQSIMAAPVRKCPECGKRKVRRLISGGGAIIFKGSGFYSTDYRSDSYKQAATKDSAPAASSSADTKDKSPAKSDSKPASTPAKPGKGGGSKAAE